MFDAKKAKAFVEDGKQERINNALRIIYELIECTANFGGVDLTIQDESFSFKKFTLFSYNLPPDFRVMKFGGKIDETGIEIFGACNDVYNAIFNNLKDGGFIIEVKNMGSFNNLHISWNI